MNQLRTFLGNLHLAIFGPRFRAGDRVKVNARYLKRADLLRWDGTFHNDIGFSAADELVVLEIVQIGFMGFGYRVAKVGDLEVYEDLDPKWIEHAR